MKTLLLLIALTLPLIAQDRQVNSRRAYNLPPQLMEDTSTHTANGVAQAPTGYPVIIGSENVPRGSTVGLYGTLLKRNQVSEVLIIANGKEYSLRATVTSELFPKLEKLVFKLPPEITGEVLVSAIGLTYSNWVRFYAE